jgi:hypothetical protein
MKENFSSASSPMQTFRVRKPVRVQTTAGVSLKSKSDRGGRPRLVGTFHAYAACMTTCLPFIDFHSTKAAPRMESAPAATET